MNAIDRFCDLQKQGFMKPRKVRVAKPTPPTVACEDCLNWHPKGRHTSDAAARKARQDARKATREDHKMPRPKRKAVDAPAYLACRARAAELGVIQAFETDLTVHDRNTLARNDAARRFLWCVGRCGRTNIVWLDPPTGETWETDEYKNNPVRARSLVDTFAESRPRMHLWNGRTLEEVDREQAVDLLVQRSEESEDA